MTPFALIRWTLARLALGLAAAGAIRALTQPTPGYYWGM